MADVETLKAQLDELLNQVEQLESGGDLAGLLEEQIGVLNQKIVETALARRHRTAPGAPDFSPSGLRGLSSADAGSRDSAPPSLDAGR